MFNIVIILIFFVVGFQTGYADPIDVKIDDNLEFSVVVEEGWIARDYGSDILRVAKMGILMNISEDPIDSSRNFDNNITIQLVQLDSSMSLSGLTQLALSEYKALYPSFALQDIGSGLIDSADTEWLLYSIIAENGVINFLTYFVVKHSYGIVISFTFDYQDSDKYLRVFDKFIENIKWK